MIGIKFKRLLWPQKDFGLKVKVYLSGHFFRHDQVQEFEFSYIRAVWAWFGPLTQTDFTPQRVLA